MLEKFIVKILGENFAYVFLLIFLFTSILYIMSKFLNH